MRHVQVNQPTAASREVRDVIESCGMSQSTKETAYFGANHQQDDNLKYRTVSKANVQTHEGHWGRSLLGTSVGCEQ